MNLPAAIREEIGQRVGLTPVAGSVPPRWSGRRDGLHVTLECRPAGAWRRSPFDDWVSVWIVGLRHPRLPTGLTLVPSLGPDRPVAVAITGDPNFDQRVRITAGPELALAALDQVTRSRLGALFEHGTGHFRDGELSYWRGSREVEVEPVLFGQDLSEAIWVAGRWTHLAVIDGLLQVARGDPLLSVRVEAAAQLSRLAPERLGEIRRTLDGLIDDRLRTPERRERLERLLDLPVVARRIDVRLGWRRTALLQKLEVALAQAPTLLPHFGELVLIRLLEGGDRERKMRVLEQLAAKGQSVEALKAVSLYTTGLLTSGDLKAAARAALRAIEPRIKAGAGSLSVVEEGGGDLSLAEAGEVSLPDEDR